METSINEYLNLSVLTADAVLGFCGLYLGE